ncbi:PaaX family transcriptional regulator [Nocardioides marmoriginsengisoli]|uniref:PaaX family transcriptional regulator n=1 Tax=Nocardioides marmoriginsengisoli TaxID=661483 RepID=A0A3N0CGQ0_9ACTN|nr:PaaX family transcriptional regulator C-terminal domain-containing protein [Nocardioides marmoriginsengisoli]RNL62634.1 PaaX family transcriptional regulator [Nocardioides marmoriginsengisoli]
MHARSALFDLYGDHLRTRGGSAPVAALIRMLEPLGVRAPAARTAVSRMVAQGWLVADPTPEGPGYALTERARTRLDEAAARIYRTDPAGWDGRWQVRVLSPIADRVRRERVRNQLRFLGMAPISDSTWISPHHSGEVDQLLLDEAVPVVSFSATDAAPSSLLLKAFDVDTLAAAYRTWLAEAGELVATGPVSDEQAFVVRSELLHSWRKFLFTDPGLPAVLLPADWPGARAAAFFDEHADRLRPAATRFIDQCLTREGATP